MAKKRILIVDDEILATREIQSFLEQTGNYWVRVEFYGKRVFPAVAEFNPDLILLDVILPDLNGTVVRAQLREHPEFKRIPVVFLTGILSQEELEHQGDLIGGTAFLAKPVTPEQVRECIQKVLVE